MENKLSVEVMYNQSDYQPIMGGDSSNPSWEEYLSQFMDEFKPHVILLKEKIQSSGMIGMTGEAQDNISFKFSDGTHWGFSWRGWGDLMQAIVDKKEGYMAYYM